MIANPLLDFDDRELFEPFFRGSSWDSWRTILKAAFGQPLSPAELLVFRDLAGGRDPPGQRVEELWVIAGRRTGKDSVEAFIAADCAVSGEFEDILRPGELATVLLLASTKDQAARCLRYVRGYFAKIPLIGSMVTRETAEGLELDNSTEIVISPNSYRSLRGSTLAVAVFDEVAFWRSEESRNPDVEIYNSVLPALSTIPGSMLVGISTPYRRSGLLYQKWSEAYGQDDPDVLVIKATSLQLNPSLSERRIARQLAKDKEAMSAEWLAEWRSDLVDYIDRATVEGLVVPGRQELPAVEGITYTAFVDPSGGSSDSFTLGVAHREGETAVLDCIREIPAPFEPSVAAAELASVAKVYRVKQVTGDAYAGAWPAEQFRKNGLDYEQSEQSKSEIYVEVLATLNSHKVELLDNRRLISQIASLERRTRRGTGLDVVDHPPSQKDDCANAALGAVLAALSDAPLVISDQMIAAARSMRRVRPDQQRAGFLAGLLASGGDRLAG